MKLVFETNLDDARDDVYSLNMSMHNEEVSIVPRVGENILFPFQYTNCNRT